MGRRLYFITHPDVVVDAATPVPQWRLSDRGLARMRAGLARPWVRTVTAVYCSGERKAIDGARILAAHLGLRYEAHDGLGENDRSATGFLPPEEFERMADRFFATPDQSVCGWETARAAQRRIVDAIEAVVSSAPGEGDIAVVSHGAVGTLLYCHLAREPISRMRDQPPTGGGNYFCFPLETRSPEHWWRPFDAPATAARDDLNPSAPAAT